MKLKALGIIAITLIFIYIILRVTNVIQFYKNETTAMEPNLKIGTTLIATNLKSPKRNSIIAFMVNPFLENNPFQIPSIESMHLSRIIGLPKDQVEIIDGLVYLNKQALNHSFETCQILKIPNKEFEKYGGEYNLKLVSEFESRGKFAHVYATEEQKSQMSSKIDFQIFDKNITADEVYEIDTLVQAGWTTNNYGPITVPDNHYFVISDNRNGSIDSRFYGFIGKEKVIGVKL